MLVYFIMKCLLAVLLVFGLTSTINSVPISKKLNGISDLALHDDLEDFIALVPKEKIVEIFYEYFENDAEVQAAFSYMGSDEFRRLVLEVESMDGVMTFYNYLQESGLDIYSLLNKFHEMIELPPLLKPKTLLPKITGGMNGLVQDIKAVLPLEKIKNLYYEKLEKSPEFAELVERLRSGKLQEIVNAMFANKDFQRIIEEIQQSGINVGAVADVLATIFGLEFPSFKPMKSIRSLPDDLNDFLALVPQDKVTEIFFEYVENDQDIQEVIDYIGGDEFKELVLILEDMPDVIDFYDYLDESGLAIYDLLNTFHEMIDLPPLKPKKLSPKSTGGLKGLIEDIKAVLPIDEIKALYYEKLESSSEFKKLVERLQNGKLQTIVNAIFDSEVFQNIIAHFDQAGIDVEAIGEFLGTIFGLEFPSNKQLIKQERALYIEFDDFLDVLPMDEIEEIAKTYVMEDEQVQMAIVYTKTPEFRELVKNIEESYHVRQFSEYLDESGIDVYDLVNQLHLHVGLPEYVPFLRSTKASGGLAGLIQDILKVVQVEPVSDLYFEKVETNQQFEFFHERLVSPKFQELVDNAINDEKFLDAVFQIEGVGIDLDEIIRVVENFIIQNFSPNLLEKLVTPLNVEEDINDFFDLIPFVEITKIGMKYLAQDPEVQKAVEYILSQEFKNLLVKLQNEEDLFAVLKYVDESGVNVFSMINLFNEFLDVPPYPQSENFLLPKAAGVQGMLNEVRSIMPYDKINEMYNDKLENSGEFKEFVERFKSPEFQKLVDSLAENDNFVELGCQAKEHGINLQHISDLLSEILGLQLPPIPDCSDSL